MPLLLLALLAAGQEDAAGWVGRLGAEDPADRERAVRALRALGPAALPELRKATASSDAEIAVRAAALREIIELEQSLPPRVRASAPDLADRLVSKRIEWIPALRELLDRERHPALRSSDVEALGPRALETATDAATRNGAVLEFAEARLACTVPHLVPLLSDPKPQVRAAAARLLSLLEARQYAPALARLLKDPEAGVVTEALRALANLKAEAALPEIAAVFLDERIWIRLQALQAAGAIGGAGIVRHLVPLLRDPQREVREHAVGLLVGNPSPEAVPALVELLGAPAVETRAAAAQVLGKLGAREALPALAGLLVDGHRDVRSAADSALKDFPPALVVPHVRPLLEDPDPERQADAMRLLGRLQAYGLREDFVRRLEAPSPAVRAAAIETLASLRDWASVPALLARLKDSDVGVRNLAVAELGKLGPDAAGPAFLGMLGDPKTRADVLGGLGRLGLRAAVGPARAFADDADEEVREAALDLLESLDPPAYRERKIPLLVARLGSEEYRSDAMRELAALGATSVSPRILEFLDDEELLVRMTARDALIELGAVDQLPGLLVRLKGPRAELRAEAAQVLGGLGRPELAVELRALLKDPESEVRSAAVEALSALEKRPAAPSIVPLLKDPVASVRASVLYELTRLGARDQADQIVPLIGDPDAEVRDAAARALNQLDAREHALALIKTFEKPESNGHGQCPYGEAQDAFRRWKPPEAVAPILGLLKDPRNGWARMVAWDTAQILEAAVPEATLLGLLQDPNGVLRGRAAGELGKAGARGAAAAIRVLLEDEDSNARLAAASVLHGWGDAAATAVLEKLCTDPLPFVRSGAAVARGREADLLALLDDPEAWVQERACEALATRGTPAAIRRLEDALGGRAQGAAATALGRLLAGAPVEDRVRVLLAPGGANAVLEAMEPGAAAPALEAAVKADPSLTSRLSEAVLARHRQFDALVLRQRDPGFLVRQRALEALWEAGKLGVEAAKSDVDPMIRRRAAELTDDEAVLGALLKDPESEVRAEAARKLCLRGSREGSAVLLAEAGRWAGVELTALNAVARPKEWAKLGEPLPGLTGHVSTEEVLRRLAEHAGLAIELPAGRRVGLRGTIGWRVQLSPIDAAAEQLRERCGFELVVEPGRLRVLAREDALAFWKRRLGN
jgi:HEAT repeat protein